MMAYRAVSSMPRGMDWGYLEGVEPETVLHSGCLDVCMSQHILRYNLLTSQRLFTLSPLPSPVKSIIGIDSRKFSRVNRRWDGTVGTFQSVVGVAVKVRDYIAFEEAYRSVLECALTAAGEELNYNFYCTNDIKNFMKKERFLDVFAREIAPHVGKVHVFYTLFSKKEIAEVKVFGRTSREQKIKLALPTRTYEELINEQLLHSFNAICAWKLLDFFTPGSIEFHLDSYGGNICEAQEALDSGDWEYYVFPGGDCSNPVISTADLLISLLDDRLNKNRQRLLFSNVRPALPEFGENVLVYPIGNRHLPSITPLKQEPIQAFNKIKHPVFWVFKGDSLINSDVLKRSDMYRNLLDYAGTQYGVVKLFERTKDIDLVEPGDYGAYLNSQGKEIIESYAKLGTHFRPFNLDLMVPKKDKRA